jgi:hypothetical protein
MESNDKINHELIEDTTGAGAPNIATTDQDLSVNQMYQQLSLPSLGRQLFSYAPLNGPTGALFNIQRKVGGNNLELLRADVEVYASAMVKSGMTQEVAQDIEAQFGRSGRQMIATLLRGIANEDENTKTTAFLAAKSKDGVDLTLSDSLNSVTVYREVSQAVQELIVDMNSKNLRTYESWCVLPAKVAAAFATSVDKSGMAPYGLFVGQCGLTKFYINPDAGSTKAYVGLKDSNNLSKSSGVFSPFHEEIVEAIDPDDGSIALFIVNRFAITASPLHKVDNEMFRMFDIL